MSSKLVPSAALLSKIVAPKAKKQMTKIMREVEIYEYMGTKVPTSLCDEDWVGLLERQTLTERIGFLEYIAVRSRRQELDEQKKQNSSPKVLFAAEEAKYAAGGMGYAPGLHQLCMNPSRNKKRIRHIETSRMVQSYNLEVPEIAIDMQYFMGMKPYEQTAMGKQLQYTISENLSSIRPMPISFYGFDRSKPNEKRVVDKLIGFYSTEYAEQVILPDFYKARVGALKPKRVAYISNTARNILDGPLRHDVYILCATKDNGRLAAASARMNGDIPAFRLPIQRYVNWQSGPMYLPLNNTVRVLRELYLNNGDWSTALHNNIAKRHLMTHEEALIENEIAIKKRHEHKRRLDELIQVIRDGTEDL